MAEDPEKVVDLVNRDPMGINGFLQVDFEDVFAEPDGMFSLDFCWSIAFTVFRCSKKICYVILTCLCACPLAFMWGCKFAIVSFKVIWIITPCMRLIHITLFPLRQILSMCLNTFVGPIVETHGLIFSRISVTNSTGEPPKPLGYMPGDEEEGVRTKRTV
jgi:hypothetical protein